MDEQGEIITIVFTILGVISLVIILWFIIWLCYRSKSKRLRQRQYQRSKKLSKTNIRKRKKRRFNTNDSTISFSFNPPHLINQNVKNLIPPESPENISTKDIDRYYVNPSTEPVYTSNASLSNFALALQMYHPTQQLNSLHFQFLNELNHVLCVEHEQRPLKYSQSCREQIGYRSITPTSISSSNQNLFQPNSRYATWTRKTQFRDDTAILY